GAALSVPIAEKRPVPTASCPLLPGRPLGVEQHYLVAPSARAHPRGPTGRSPRPPLLPQSPGGYSAMLPGVPVVSRCTPSPAPCIRQTAPPSRVGVWHGFPDRFEVVCRALLAVQACTELFAGLEKRHCLARDVHADAGARVTAGTGGAILE